MNHLQTSPSSNRVAVISGASRGLGKTIAEFLAARGYHLIVTARNESALAESASELRRFGGEVTAFAGDVRSEEHRAQIVEAVHQLGRLDLLVNNASLLGPSPQPALADYPLETLRNVLEANLIAPVALVQALIPTLQTTQGLIVNISSDAAVGGYAQWGGYGASKAALDLVTITLANELRAQNIAVVSVDPGDMRTQMHQDAFPGEDISDRPLPTVTIPFWAWLLGQPHAEISGRRFQAQAETWVV